MFNRAQVSAFMTVVTAVTGITASAALAASSTPFKGHARSGRRTSDVSFRLTGREGVVNFQLAGLDVEQMTVDRFGHFAGCNTREDAHPCVTGHFDRSRRSATGTLRYGRGGLWTWSADQVS
jgi:hypothetical protein